MKSHELERLIRDAAQTIAYLRESMPTGGVPQSGEDELIGESYTLKHGGYEKNKRSNKPGGTIKARRKPGDGAGPRAPLSLDMMDRADDEAAYLYRLSRIAETVGADPQAMRTARATLFTRLGKRIMLKPHGGLIEGLEALAEVLEGLAVPLSEHPDTPDAVAGWDQVREQSEPVEAQWLHKGETLEALNVNEDTLGRYCRELEARGRVVRMPLHIEKPDGLDARLRREIAGELDRMPTELREAYEGMLSVIPDDEPERRGAPSVYRLDLLLSIKREKLARRARNLVQNRR